MSDEHTEGAGVEAEESSGGDEGAIPGTRGIRYLRPGRLISDIHIRAMLARMNRKMSMRVMGQKIGVSRQHVWEVIHGRQRPGPKILQFFKLERVPLYQRHVGRPRHYDQDHGEDR